VKGIFMAARMRKKVDRAALKPAQGLEMTVGEVERLLKQPPVPGALLMESKGQQLNRQTKTKNFA